MAKSKIAQKILDKATDEYREKVDEYTNQILAAGKIDWDAYWNKRISLLHAHGFNPIAICILMCEDTFAFETDEEAKRAYNTFECDSNGNRIGKLVGWWYGRQHFMQSVNDEQKITKQSIKIRWL